MTAAPSLLDMFEQRCWARALLWHEWCFDLHEAVDVLAADAERDGIDTDTAQAIMADAFGATHDA